MAIFEDRERQYTSNSQSSCQSLSGTSANGSFYAWDDTCTTPPPSVRQNTSGSLSFEDMPFCPADSPEEFGSWRAMSLLAFETFQGYEEHGILLPQGKTTQAHPMTVGNNSFPMYIDGNLESFSSNHGLPLTRPILDADLSSPVSSKFVVPSQTTFHNILEAHSPMPSLHFSSPPSDYSATQFLDQSPMDNMSICLQYDDCRSVTTTPSRPASTRACRSAQSPRDPIHNLTWTSAELQRLQSEDQPALIKQERVRRGGRQVVKRASDAPIQASSKNVCPFEECAGKFKRSEHLKRHVRIHYPGLYPPQQCPFCPKKINAGRGDNLGTHVGLHNDKKKKRTSFDERAGPWLAQREAEKGKKKVHARANKHSKGTVKMEFPTRLRVEEH